MTATPNSRPPSKLRQILAGGWILVAVVAIYSGWILWSRWQERHDLEARVAAEKAEHQRADDERTVEMLGGNKFDILNFYAAPGVIRRGDAVDICYGVSNAKSLTLEPQSSPVWPSLNHCVSVFPRKTTRYTLTVIDASGNKKTSTLTVQVR
ncbi:MAG: hypothetical protein ACRD50_08735 [Candidatus Acidiferrales bacterium]